MWFWIVYTCGRRMYFYTGGVYIGQQAASEGRNECKARKILDMKLFTNLLEPRPASLCFLSVGYVLCMHSIITPSPHLSLGRRRQRPELVPHLGLAELPRVPPQHDRALVEAHGLLPRPDGHERARQDVVALLQQAHRDEDVVDVVEDERVLRGVVGPLGEEGGRVVAPVPEGVEVVAGMVAVVEAEAVGRNIHQRHTRAVIRVGLIGVDKRVLAPVADHESDAEEEQRQPKDKRRGRGVGLEGGKQRNVAANLPEGGLAGQHGPAGPPEVARQVEPHKEEEAAEVHEEVRQAVALVTDRRRQVARAVALDVVVLDVVVEVAVPRVAHERIHDVGKQLVDDGKAAGEHAALVDVLVLEQRVRPHVGALQRDVQDGMEVAEAGEEQHGAGDRGAKVQQQVRHEDGVGLDAHHAPRPGDVALKQAPQEARRDEGARLVQVVRREDGRLEARVGRVVERLQLGDDGLGRVDSIGVHRRQVVAELLQHQPVGARQARVECERRQSHGCCRCRCCHCCCRPSDVAG